MERRLLGRRLLLTTIGSVTAVVIMVTVLVSVVAYLRVRRNMLALAYQDSTNVVERLRTCALIDLKHHEDHHEGEEKSMTPLEHLSYHLASMEKNGTGYLDICDRSGHILAYAPQERRGSGPLIAHRPLWVPGSKVPLTRADILKRDLVTAGEMRTPGATPEVVAVAAIPQLGWVIRYHEPETSVEKRVESATLPILWILALVVLTVPLQAFLFIRTIVNPYGLRPLEEEVEAERAEADALLDAVVDGVVVIGPDYKIMRTNRAVADMQGDIVSQPCRDALACPTEDCCDCPAQYVLETGRTSRTVRQVIRYNPAAGRDETRWEETVATPLYGRQKEIIAAIEVIRDITERKRAEDRLAHSARLRALGELAAGIAHEIRTPMNGVTVFLEGVQEEARRISAPKEMLHDLQLIREQADRVVGITERILSFAKSESPRMDFVSVQEVISRLLEFVGSSIRADGIQLRQEYEPNLPPIYCNFDELYEVLLNLLVNAQDAMPDGGVISLSAAYKNSEVVVTVADTGSGIPAENLARIFDPGFSTKTDQGVAKGLGLGLFLAQGIVESFGGTITAHSVVGQGTTFVLTFPAAPTAPLTPVAAQHAIPTTA